jgi:hypothetical protein
MAPEDVLPNIAEIAIGLAGFSGLVAAFGQRPGQSWRGDQKARIVFLVILSFGMITSALLPSALSGISDSPALVWGVPMVAYSVLAIGLLVYWVALSRRHGYQLQFPLVSIPIITVAAALQVVVLLSGLGLFVPYSPTLFVFGLLSVLVFGANMFLALLHITWRD